MSSKDLEGKITFKIATTHNQQPTIDLPVTQHTSNGPQSNCNVIQFNLIKIHQLFSKFGLLEQEGKDGCLMLYI